MIHGVSLEQARHALAAATQPFTEVFRRGTFSAELYAPRGQDFQTPHLKDEVYLVISGSGTYFCEGERRPFGPGDLLFAAAGQEHHFENFSDDFAVWVIFYGPDGGEKPGLRVVLGEQHQETT
ncbi:cupin domain-containing protein [Deinococcus sp.]|uniref:cupin domain-containing protein n=1 Tax=Deinococcus sp. TaxID=47478 RepID=UPI003B5B78B3